MGLGEQESEGDLKAPAQFKDHMQKSQAASEFSKSKTTVQQRRSLPVYQVRDDLMQVQSSLPFHTLDIYSGDISVDSFLITYIYIFMYELNVKIIFIIFVCIDRSFARTK